MNQRGDRIEEWLDGELQGSELREFEERAAADARLAADLELASRLNASLKRTFAPDGAAPVGALRVAESLRPRAAPRTPARVWTWGALGVCAGLAAACLLVLRLLPGGGGEGKPSDRAHLEAPTPAPLTGAALVDLARPDLEDIYCSAQAYATRQDWVACDVHESESTRVGELIADHGGSIGLWPTAALELEGPIHSPEWPGSMIFAGGESGELAVLIAERDAMNTCCLDVRLPESSDLHLHSWRVGEVLWFEVSPFEQPRYLPRLRSELQ